jgi:hypothetical protein
MMLLGLAGVGFIVGRSRTLPSLPRTVSNTMQTT